MNDITHLVNIILADFMVYLEAQINPEMLNKRLDKSFFPSIHCVDKNDKEESNNGCN